MAYRMGYRQNQEFTLGPMGFLILANIIVFVATSIKPGLVPYLALGRGTIISQPWTIVTSMFVHANFFHIFFNMYALYFFGEFLIRMLGEKVFFIVYFIGGLLGGLFFLLLAPPYSYAIGASGAVFSVIGTVVVLRPKVKIFIFPIPVPFSLWIAVIGFILLSFGAGIAWQAHIGGLIFGLIVGYIYRRRRIIFL